MALVDGAPKLVGAITLGVGAALTARPALATRPLGLEGREAEVRAIGLVDLVAGAGLLRARTAWPWMAARAGLNVVMLARVPEGRRTFAVLIALDGGTTLALWALGRRRS